jgi:hypothetical protein
MMRAIRLAVACVAVLIATAGQAQAGVITGSLGGSFGTFSAGFTQGYDFSVSTSGTIVTALGIFDDGANGLGGTYQIGLWDTVSEALLGSVLVNNTNALDSSVTISGGQYRYGSLTSGVSLSAGTTYTLAAYLPVGTNAPLEHSFTYGSGVVGSADRRFESAGFGFPSFIAPNQTSGLVNAQFGSNNATVPEPTSLAMFAIGACVAGLGAARRRRRVEQPKVAV